MSRSEILKFGLCAVLALSGLLTHIRLSASTHEIRSRRRLIVAILLFKTALFVPLLGSARAGIPVDPAIHYLPEARAVLHGQLPYRDFESAYSPLFPVLIAPAVALWDSVGSLALFMIACEALMLTVYLADRPSSILRWRAATLYAVSPISLYWIGVGYHSGLIATFTVIALVLIRRGRDFSAGLAAAAGFLVTKLTAIVVWPALVFYDRSPRMLRRSAGLSLAVAVMALLSVLGLDVLQPIRLEAFRASPGNIPNIIGTLWPSVRSAPVFKILPFVLLACAWLPGAYAVLRSERNEPRGSDAAFDYAAAFIAFSYLVFMITSRKAYTFYGPTFLLFTAHACLVDARRLPMHVAALAVLGATTTLEIALASEYLINAREAFRFPSAALDLLIVAAYAWLAWVCLGILRGRQVRAAASLPLVPTAAAAR